VYRMAKPLSFCLDQLKISSGSQFDPQVVEVAIDVINRGIVHTQADHTPEEIKGLMPLSATSTLQAGALHV